MLEISIYYNQEVPILELEGQFNALGATIFDEKIKTVETLPRFLIIDFARVGFMSSAGIRSLLKLEKELKERKGFSILTGIGHDIAQVLEITGLKQHIRMDRNLDEALGIIDNANKRESDIREFISGNRKYLIKGLGKRSSKLKLWGPPAGGDSDASGLIFAGLKELDFAVGTGSPGPDRNSAMESMGHLLSTGRFIGFRPSNHDLASDFLVAETTAEVGVYVGHACSIGGEPSLVIQHDEPEMTFGQMVQDIYQFLGKELHLIPPFIAIAGLCQIEGEERSRFGAGGLFSLAVVVHKSALEEFTEQELAGMLKEMASEPFTDELYEMHVGVGIELPVGTHDHYNELSDAVHDLLKVENIFHIDMVDADTLFQPGTFWIFLPED